MCTDSRDGLVFCASFTPRVEGQEQSDTAARYLAVGACPLLWVKSPLGFKVLPGCGKPVLDMESAGRLKDW